MQADGSSKGLSCWEGRLIVRARTAPKHMGVSKNRGNPPTWMVKIMEPPIKMDDLGVPLFLETPILSVSGLEDTMLQIAQEYRVPAGVPKYGRTARKFWWCLTIGRPSLQKVWHFPVQKRGFPSKNRSACSGEATCALFGSLVRLSCRAFG